MPSDGHLFWATVAIVKTLCIESLLANIPGCARTWRHATCFNARSWKVPIALNLFSCPNVVSLLALPLSLSLSLSRSPTLSLSKTTRAWRCCPECIKLFRSFLLLIPPFVFLQIADEMSGGLHTQYFATCCSRRDGSYSAPFRRF